MESKGVILNFAIGELVHSEIRVRDERVFKGTPFTVEIELTGGKKWMLVEKLETEMYFQTVVPDDRTTATLIETGLMVGGIVMSVLSPGAIINYPGIGLLRTIRIPLHKWKIGGPFKLGPKEKKLIEITPTIPDEYPMGIMSFVMMKEHIEVSKGKKWTTFKKISIYPNLYSSAPMILLMERYDFKEKGLIVSNSFMSMRETPTQPHEGERFVFVARERPYRHVKEISLTVTDLHDGRIEYVLAFEMYRDPDSMFKGKHETVMAHFELHKDRVVRADGSPDMDYVGEKLQSAFDEAEDMFGRDQSFKT